MVLEIHRNAGFAGFGVGNSLLLCETWRTDAPCQKVTPEGLAKVHTKTGPRVATKIRNLYTVFQKKTGPFVISSYLCFDSYELHEIFQNYVGGIACCEYGINVCDFLTILC